MANLYKVLIQHYAPKGSDTGVFRYLFAENDRQVFDWFESEKMFLEPFEEVEGYQTREDYISNKISNRGDINDEYLELEDLHYGVTIYGWTLEIEDVYANSATWKGLWALDILNDLTGECTFEKPKVLK